jgi:hypothetical protein
MLQRRQIWPASRRCAHVRRRFDLVRNMATSVLQMRAGRYKVGNGLQGGIMVILCTTLTRVVLACGLDMQDV